MKKQIFPKEILEDTFEVHQFLHGKKSKVIYTIILLTLLGIIVALPLVKVDVYASARGIIKPDKERVPLYSIRSGKIVYAKLKNHQSVVEGDTLLVIENPIDREKNKLLSKQITNAKAFIYDIEMLLQSSPKKVQTQKYKREYALYQQGLYDLQIKYKKRKSDFQRDSILYHKEVISKADFENTCLEYEVSQSDIKQHKRRQSNQWQSALTELKNTLEELFSTQKQLDESQSQYVITVPAAGTLLEVRGLDPGGFVTAGQLITQISPDGELLAECYVAPAEIGYLKIGRATKFQVDAFNYNQWGMATGKVLEIGKDIEMINNNAVFKVRCRINERSLKLKNGVEGKFQKGMTLTARFQLAERTLFDLLYDKVDDWLNPSKNHSASGL